MTYYPPKPIPTLYYILRPCLDALYATNTYTKSKEDFISWLLQTHYGLPATGSNFFRISFEWLYEQDDPADIQEENEIVYSGFHQIYYDLLVTFGNDQGNLLLHHMS